MNTFVNMSQQYGPNIAQQAMATVSLLIISCKVSFRGTSVVLPSSSAAGQLHVNLSSHERSLKHATEAHKRCMCQRQYGSSREKACLQHTQHVEPAGRTFFCRHEPAVSDACRLSRRQSGWRSHRALHRAARAPAMGNAIATFDSPETSGAVYAHAAFVFGILTHSI